MEIIKKHALLGLVVVFVFACLVQAGAGNSGHAEAQLAYSGGVCPTGNQISLDANANTTGTPPPGVRRVSLAVAPVMAPQVKSVLFTIDGSNILGRGVQLNSNPFYEMQWLTQTVLPGSHTIGATITTTNGTCQVPPVAVSTTAYTTNLISKIELHVSPQKFDGLTNEPRNFVLLAKATDGRSVLDITPWTLFKISPVSLGAVMPADGSNTFRFSAGPSGGEGAINVLAQYGGLQQPLDIPVRVSAQPTVAPTAPKTTTASGQPAPTVHKEQAIAAEAGAATAKALDSDTPVKQCVVAKVGAPKYDQIISGTIRPSEAEFEALRQCFAVRNYVVPSGLTPVVANKEIIQQQPASGEIKVANAKTVTETANGSSKQALRFSGKAKPNATVLIYIFSEPLVVTTSADANGDWSYSLEDPLEPGKHEAYALVSRGDGSYERSSVFSFAVARAEAAESNPNGLSLNLERTQPTATRSSTPVALYIGSVAGLLLIVLLAAWFWLRRRAAKQPPEPADTLAAPEDPAKPKDPDTEQ